MRVGARFGKRSRGDEDLLAAGHVSIEDDFAAVTAGGEGENSVGLHNQQLQSA